MIEEKNRKKRKKSVILDFINKFTNAFYDKAKNGFLGKAFTAYTRENLMFRDGFFSKFLNNRSKNVSAFSKAKFFVSERIENSLSLELWKRFIRFLAGCKIRFYGTFLFCFGAYTAIVYVVRKYLLFVNAETEYAVFGVMMAIIALPMFFSGKTVSKALSSSVCGSFISKSTLGISNEKFEINDVKHGDKYNIAILAGVVFGSATYFVNPFAILAGIGIVISAAVVMYSPESGVVLTLLSFPLSFITGNDNVVFYLTVLFSVSYFVKLLRGKRIIAFEIIDVAVLLFVFAVFCGTVSSAGEPSLKPWIMIFMIIGSFVAGNLMRTKKWQTRFLSSYLFSATVIALFAIIGRFAKGNSLSYLKIFSDVSFEGNLVAAKSIFLIALFAGMAIIAFGVEFNSKSVSIVLITLINAFALILTCSGLEFIGVIVGVLAFFLMVRKNTLTVLLFGVVLVPTAVCLFPSDFIRSSASVFGFKTDSNYFALGVFEGTANMISKFPLTGVGMNGFSEIYPMFSVMGCEDSSGIATTQLTIMSELGILGIVLIGLTLLLFLQNCFEFLTNCSDSKMKCFVSAGASLVIGIFVQSGFSNVFVEPKTLFLFFFVIYVVCSCIRSGRLEAEKKKEIEDYSDAFATVEIKGGF